MKKTSLIIIFIVAVAGYFLANSSVFKKAIEGDIALEVKIVAQNQDPLSNIEVNVSQEPGQPPVGGTMFTDETGTAVFHVRPGSYFIFFNSNNFPSGFDYPAPTPVRVEEGQSNFHVITLMPKQS